MEHPPTVIHSKCFYFLPTLVHPLLYLDNLCLTLCFA